MPKTDTMELDILVPFTEDLDYETVKVTKDTPTADIINQLTEGKEGKFILTTKGVYAHGSDLDTSKKIGENIKFVGGTSIQLHLSPKTSDPTKRGKKLVEELRKTIRERGGRSYRALLNIFDVIDWGTDGRQLDRTEIKNGLRHFGMSISLDEASSLIRAIDYDSSGTVSINEFIRCIRGALNATRLDVVRRAFNKFDANQSGTITMSDLSELGYKAQKDKFLRQFFDQFQEDQGSDELDDEITRDEFEEYYARESANIDDDMHFVQLVEKAWDLEPTV